MIRKALGLAAALSMIGAADAALARDPPFLGAWARADGKTHIRVWHCGASVCAANTWVEPGIKSEKVGDKLVFDVQPSGRSHWSGSAFDPQRDRRYSVKVDVSSHHMTTHGCIMGGLMCHSMKWTRLASAK
jgi:uncharacterized protein (DUF2147 family)